MKIKKLLPLVAFAAYAAAAYSCTKADKNIEDWSAYQPTTYTDLSADGTANCYLISDVGGYKFKTVRGNTDVSVGDVAEASVLWESFGTDVKPREGALIASVSYNDGYISFATRNTFAQGNAVIAAKDSDGTILWSWHIWCSSEGWVEQEYFNDAGTMMDRNLGAVSATPGDVGALGLLYQWGRKDPFLNSSSISSNIQAVSTGEWSLSNAKKLSDDLCIKTPMTYYKDADDYLANENWGKNKTEYDPCPAGWKIPYFDVWARGLNFQTEIKVEQVNEIRGVQFGGKLGPDTNIWYPASGYLQNWETPDHLLVAVGQTVRTHSSSAYNYGSHMYTDRWAHSSYYQPFNKGVGCTVRCQKSN